MTDGKLWSPIGKTSGVIFSIDNNAIGHLSSSASGIPKNSKQAVQGVVFVLQDGKVIDFDKGMMNQRHPRTVVGLDGDGKTLTLLTVDGRNPFHSIGMTGTELGQEMKNVGCTDAVNMDGGGSTELVMRDADGKLQVVNHPSDLRERAVADTIGISVDGTKRVEEKK
jgi:exopolysaccharide biosynthesis protein